MYFVAKKIILEELNPLSEDVVFRCTACGVDYLSY